MTNSNTNSIWSVITSCCCFCIACCCIYCCTLLNSQPDIQSVNCINCDTPVNYSPPSNVVQTSLIEG